MAVLLARFLARRSARPLPGGFAFSFSPAEFRALFHEACGALGLRGAYVPHSLRGGGATHDFERMRSSTVDITHIMIRGRWTSAKSLFTYCQAGKSLLLQVAEPPDLLRLGAAFAASLRESLRLAALMRLSALAESRVSSVAAPRLRH